MDRLNTERRRLHLLADPPAGPGDPSAWIGPDGQVRALMLEVNGPGAWTALGAAWRGVQETLELPAPAIAVSGGEGLQLWFSLAEALPLRLARAFLAGLRHHLLAEVRPERLQQWPPAQEDIAPGLPPQVPACRSADPGPGSNETDGERWSAFVAADLAPMFDDEPWLGLAPPPDGQAELLARLRSIPLADVRRCLALWEAEAATAQPPAAMAASAAQPRAPLETASVPNPVHNPAHNPSCASDPRLFLQEVMTDPQVPLALRIEAARALLSTSPNR